MKLLLVRHGNTFTPEQTPYYVGAKTDLPLVSSGHTQAALLAEAVQAAGLGFSGIYCSYLQRTSQHVAPVQQLLGVPAIQDKRLNEIDYGLWEGKTNHEVDALYGSDQPRLKWDRDSIRPIDAGFLPAEAEIVANINSLIDELITHQSPNSAVLICSSNGVLRYFLKHCNTQYEQRRVAQQLKVATGNICGIECHHKNQMQLLFWNEKPCAKLLMQSFK